MNRYQPGANIATVDQRIAQRLNEAAGHRQLRAVTGADTADRWTKWRCAVGNRLIAAGEGLITPKPPTLPAV